MFTYAGESDIGEFGGGSQDSSHSQPWAERGMSSIEV